MQSNSVFVHALKGAKAFFSSRGHAAGVGPETGKSSSNLAFSGTSEFILRVPTQKKVSE